MGYVVKKLVLCLFFGYYRWLIIMHVEGFVVCMSGKMAQDVGMVHVEVLWWHSHLVCLVFEGTIPTCACLYLAKKFVTCVCCFLACLMRSLGHCQI